MAEKLHYDSATGTTFKEAFADARKEGKKTFEWNGKKYGTKLKGEDEPKQGKVKEDSTIEAGKRQKPTPKEEKEDKRSRGTAAALAGAGVGLGAMAALSGMRKSEQSRKDREMSKGREERSQKSPVRNITPEEAAFENEGGRYYRKGGKVRKFGEGGSTSKSIPRRMYENVMGTPEQNEQAQKRMDERDKKNPDSLPAKINRAAKSVTGKKGGGAIKKYDDGGAIKTMKDMVVQGAKKTGEDIHRIIGTEKGKALDKQAQEKRGRGIDIEKLYDASRKRDEASRYKKGGMTASFRGDGIAMRGKTKGRMV